MKKSSEELLLEISWRQSPEEKLQAEKSLDEFLKRFGNYCKKLIYVNAKDDLPKFEDLYRLFILDIWEHAQLYDDSKQPNDPPDIRIKKWLSYRMLAVLRAYWKELFKDHSKLSLDEITAPSYTPPEQDDQIIGEEDVNLKKLKIAMIKDKVLNNKELDILRTFYQYKGEIPKEIREAICKQYSIVDNTIRTIRYRALKKVAGFISRKEPLIR